MAQPQQAPQGRSAAALAAYIIGHLRFFNRKYERELMRLPETSRMPFPDPDDLQLQNPKTLMKAVARHINATVFLKTSDLGFTCLPTEVLDFLMTNLDRRFHSPALLPLLLSSQTETAILDLRGPEEQTCQPLEMEYPAWTEEEIELCCVILETVCKKLNKLTVYLAGTEKDDPCRPNMKTRRFFKLLVSITTLDEITINPGREAGVDYALACVSKGNPNLRKVQVEYPKENRGARVSNAGLSCLIQFSPHVEVLIIDSKHVSAFTAWHMARFIWLMPHLRVVRHSSLHIAMRMYSQFFAREDNLARAPRNLDTEFDIGQFVSGSVVLKMVRLFPCVTKMSLLNMCDVVERALTSLEQPTRFTDLTLTYTRQCRDINPTAVIEHLGTNLTSLEVKAAAEVKVEVNLTVVGQRCPKLQNLTIQAFLCETAKVSLIKDIHFSNLQSLSLQHCSNTLGSTITLSWDLLVGLLGSTDLQSIQLRRVVVPRCVYAILRAKAMASESLEESPFFSLHVMDSDTLGADLDAEVCLACLAPKLMEIQCDESDDWILSDTEKKILQMFCALNRPSLQVVSVGL